MRITGGSARGQQIKIPQTNLVRPTTDKVREAIFSIIAPYISEKPKYLDLFAGSGALGIEALSRGAEWVDFVDQSSKSHSTIKFNLNKLGFSQRAHVYCCSVEKALNFLETEYDFIFMDAPYADPATKELVPRIGSSLLMGERSLMVVSHASRFPLDKSYDKLSLIKERRYGDTCISIYSKEVQF